MSHSLPRRQFLRTAGTAAGTALGLAALPGAAGATSASVRAGTGLPLRRQAEPWGRIEAVGPGTWALISTPLNDAPEARRTLCNGGIIAGSEATVVVEGFASPAGAAWMADTAEDLTGRPPTHVVITHFHGDHTGGTAGYVRGASIPEIMATATTRRLLAEQAAEHDPVRRDARPLLLPDTVLPDDVEETLDLGDRQIRLIGYRGHTPSDLAVQAGGVVFAGDLVWQDFFPNYTHAIPPALSGSVRALRALDAEVYVSGHGGLARATDMAGYASLLEHVGAAAREALEAGTPLAEAAAEYVVPDRLGEWAMFSPRYPEIAFRAWARALGSETQ